MANNSLIIFVKNLVPGMVKTRLAKDIGISLALNVYQELVAHTADVVKKIDADKMVFYSEYIEVEDLFEGEDFDHNIQVGNTLGERMSNAFNDAFNRGYTRVIIIGSDCYELKKKHLDEAIDQLKIHDVVVGPANDGGYYLLGLNAPCPTLFDGKQYSHNKVFEELIKNIQELKLAYHIMEKLTDIDTLEDMHDTPLMKILDEPEKDESNG